MKLFSLPHSPFCRKVLVTAHEKSLTHRIDVQEAHVFVSDAPVHRVTPLGKVPVLIDDQDQALYDSTVICEYLDRMGPAPWLIPESGVARWQVLRLNALGDGLAEAATWGIRERIRDQHERSLRYVRHFERTMINCLQEADNLVASNDITLGDITLACALSYIDLRYPDLNWRTDYSRPGTWYHGISGRPSMQATPLSAYNGPRQPPA